MGTSLETLKRLRSLDLLETQRQLSGAIANEAKAEEAINLSCQVLEREEAYAMDPQSDDGAVEAFGRWLPEGRRAIERARREAERAALDVAVAQAAFLAARKALKTIEALCEKCAEEERHARLADEQKILDDFQPGQLIGLSKF